MNNLGDLLRANMNPPKPDITLNVDQRKAVRNLITNLVECVELVAAGKAGLQLTLLQLETQSLSDRLGLDNEG